jgi:transcriptional regulator with XRE-family HTH domain
MTFAENLRRLRIDRFLSQRELARQAGLHPVTLTRLEAGAAAPSTRSVRALAVALGVEPRALSLRFNPRWGTARVFGAGRRASR